MFRHILSICLCFMCIVLAAETSETNDTNEPFRVAVKIAPPFVMQNPDGGFKGIAIDAWNEIATANGLSCSYVNTSMPDLLAGVHNGTYDAGIGAISVTSEREKDLDFTHPFFRSGFGIATHAQGDSLISQVLFSLVSWDFLKVVLALLALLGLVGIAVWWCERKHNPEQFGGHAAQGIASGLWWSAVTMTTVGYGDKAPLSFAGRTLGLLWMFASIIIISSFTAAIASSLTVDGLQSRIQNIHDLQRADVGVIEGTSGAQFAAKQGYTIHSYPSVEAAVTALGDKKVDAIVHDRPILQYACQAKADLVILADKIKPHDYAFVIPRQSPHRKAFNLTLIRFLSTAQWQEVLTDYLGSEY